MEGQCSSACENTSAWPDSDGPTVTATTVTVAVVVAVAGAVMAGPAIFPVPSPGGPGCNGLVRLTRQCAQD